MKKIFLHAYDQINLGDDLFIHTIVNRYPHVKFYMWSDIQNRITFRVLEKLTILNKDSKFLGFLQKVRPSFAARYKAWWEKRCDAVVYIGGSIFIEYDNWKQILNWWEYEAENRSFYALGANFGPYQSEEYRKRLYNIFEKMQDVCFRDRYSYQKFEGNKAVRCASDILFSIEMPKVEQIKKQIFLSVIDVDTKDEGKNILSIYCKEYIEKISEVIKEYVQRGYSVVISSFCKIEGDEDAINKILNHLSNCSRKYIYTLNYDGTNAEEILKEIASSEGIIASRFHAAILGIAAGRPVFPIVYSNKTIHALEDMNFKGEYVDIRNLKELDFVKVQKNLSKLPVYPINELRESAQKHFKKLDEVLKE